MRARISALLCAAMLALAVPPLCAVILDRIAVTVGNQVITQSEIVTDLRVSAFLDQKPVDLAPQARRADAGRLVDQILILQEAADSHFILPSETDAAAQVEKQKAQFASVDAYRDSLAKYHITEADLSTHLLSGIRALAFTDLRFRPEIEISDSDLRAEYDKLAEQARQTNGALPSFEASRDQLEQLLSGERVMQALDQWLEMARQSHNVQYRDGAFK